MKWSSAHVALVAPLALAALACARGPNVSTEELELKRVVVYRNGVGYYERSGRVEADQVTFKMRRRMVGDFLATLAIVERGGSTVRSASFPLDIDTGDEDDEVVDPRYQSLLKPWPGKPPKKHDPNALEEVVLSLDGREHDLAVGYVSETPVWRPSYRLVVRPDGSADLQAWGIVTNLSGEDWKNIRLSLVAGAPIAFESTLGQPVVPPRPVVTDSGEVIMSVPEAVTSLREREAEGGDGSAADEDSGRPADAPAAEAEYFDAATGGEGLDDRNTDMKAGTRRRPSKIAVSGRASGAPAAPPPPPGYGGPMGAAAPEPTTLASGAPSRPRRMSALAAVAIEGGTTRYEIPTPVTVPDESATMVLLVSKTVPGEAVFLFAPDGGVPESGSHPFRVARFSNATKGLLERGPIAVFEKGSFLGQGMLDQLPPDAKATVPFALERSLAVQSESKYSEAGARLSRVELGQLYIERDTVTNTTYTVKNGSADLAKLLVKHPRTQGSRLIEPPPGTEDNIGAGHALVPTEIAGHRTAKLTVDERLAFERGEDWLSDAADEAVRAYLADARADRVQATKLSDAWKARELLKRAVDEQRKLVDEQGELERMTRETRLSLEAIEKNQQAADLRAKLTKRLKDGTGRLEEITKRLIEVGMALNEHEVRFRDSIREVRIAKALETPKGR